MNNDTRFDALIAAARPEKSHPRAEFTDRVMQSIASPEILSSQIRRMNDTKKETFIMKLRHLPKFAIVAIAVGALLLLSTGVYATYQLLWPKPEVTVSAPTTSQNGREEVAISFAQCGDTAMAQRFELKRNAIITSDQIAGVVKGQCELKAIGAWSEKEFGSEIRNRMLPHGTEPYDNEYARPSMASLLTSRSATSLTFGGLEKYHQSEKTLPTTENVRYFADGMQVKASDIAENSPVVYIVKYREHMTPKPGCDNTHCSISSTLLGEELLAVVKLSLPFENYDQLAWQSLTEKMVCTGNEADTCLTGYIGGIDLFMGSDAKLNVDGFVYKEIQGVITKIEGPTITIRSSSGTLFTLVPGKDIVNEFNTTRTQHYNNRKIEVGNSVGVRYYEPKDKHEKTLTSRNIAYISLQLEMVSKGDPLNAY